MPIRDDRAGGAVIPGCLGRFLAFDGPDEYHREHTIHVNENEAYVTRRYYAFLGWRV
jgi:hypothetical protein